MSTSGELSRFERLFSILVIVTVIALTAWPVSWKKGRDSFPLSSYPMFARHAVEPAVRLHYAYGTDPAGNRYGLSPSHVANHEVLQARAVLGRAVAGGKAETERLCRRIAERVADDAELSSVTRITIVTGRHDAVAFLAGERGPETVRGSCEVER